MWRRLMLTEVLSMESQSVSRFGKIKRKGQILKCLALIEQGLSGAVWFICISSLNPTIYEALSLSLCLSVSPHVCGVILRI